MDWNERILDVARDTTGDPSMSSLVEALFEQQSRTWPQLREGLEAAVEVRRLDIHGLPVLLQHNPRRIVSTSARVDDKSIRERPCFLCSENMPDEEKGLNFGEGLVVFCNPFPVLARHLVVLSREHIPQRLDGHIDQFLDLARSLGSDYAALYNGAKCGASAPDHLHFQAGRIERLTVFDEIARHPEQDGKLKLRSVHPYGAGFIWFRALDSDLASATIKRLMDTLNRESGDDEPMVNVLARHDGTRWEIVVIPRRKHRPASYFAEGDARILVSPAAIDLAGLVVVPREVDFMKLDPVSVEGIFSEVTLSESELEVIAALAKDKSPAEARS
jgi:hypothetical protein